MTEHEYVMVTLDMLPEDAEALVRANESEPVVAEFEHHAEPIKVAFGEVKSVTWANDSE